MSYLYKPETSNALVQPVKSERITLSQSEIPHRAYKPVATPKDDFPVSLNVHQMYQSLARYGREFELRKKTIRPFLKQMKRSSFKTKVPNSFLIANPAKLEAIPAPHVPVEYATLAPIKVASKMEDAVYGAEEGFLAEFINLLRQDAGRIVWVNDSIVKADHRTNDMTEAAISRAVVLTAGQRITKTNMKIDIVETCNYRELLHAKRRPLTLDPSMPMRTQDFVRFLREEMQWLLPHVTMVDGTQVYAKDVVVAHQSTQQEVVTVETLPTPKYDYDPFFCIGDLVLHGYDEGEA